MPRGWFVYNGSGVVTATGNYTYIDHQFECKETGIPCVVYAYYSPGTPILGITNPTTFSTRIQGYLNSAAAATQPLPLGTGRKKYVYIRGAFNNG